MHFFFFTQFTVMRLTKPTLFTNIPVTCEEKDLPGMAHALFSLPREKLKPGLPIVPCNKPSLVTILLTAAFFVACFCRI